MSHKARTVSLFASALVLAFAPGPAQAQVVKPFKVTGGGLVPGGISLIPKVPAFHNATGQATELGAYYGEGMFQLLDTAGHFSSAPDFVFTAANGDNLAFTYGDVGNGAKQAGQVTLQPLADGRYTAVFVAEFNPDPEKCTGRFAKVTGGSFIMVAKSAPFFILGTQTTPFAYTWEGQGSIEFRQGK